MEFPVFLFVSFLLSLSLFMWAVAGLGVVSELFVGFENKFVDDFW